MKQIQEMLGHSTITTTMDIYTNVDSVLEQAAAIDLDKVLFG
jgi:Site-specific recombinase XerD